METQITLGEIVVDVIHKDIKNIHLSVHPPAGSVRISAPLWMTLDTIRVFAISRVNWIRQKQKKFLAQERETSREYLDRESHFVWGKRYLLQVIETGSPPSVELNHSRMTLRMRPGTDEWKKRSILEEWYRAEIKKAMPALIAKWEPLLNVTVSRVYVQRMKTRWGSCNQGARTIRLNTELAKKPPEFLEYIILHEMVHLIEKTHNARFVAWMEQFMPQWRFYRDRLNRLPVMWPDQTPGIAIPSC